MPERHSSSANNSEVVSCTTPSGHAGRPGRGRAALRALRAVKCPVASPTGRVIVGGEARRGGEFSQELPKNQQPPKNEARPPATRPKVIKKNRHLRF